MTINETRSRPPMAVHVVPLSIVLAGLTRNDLATSKTWIYHGGSDRFSENFKVLTQDLSLVCWTDRIG